MPEASQPSPQPNAPAAGQTKPPRRGASAVGLVFEAVLVWIGAVAVTAIAIMLPPRLTFPNSQAEMIASWLFLLPALVLAIMGTAILIVGSVRWAVYGRSATGPTSNTQDLQAVLQQMNQRLLVSETAKRLAFRDQDVQVLRQTIQRDMEHHNYDAALVLVEELSRTYGQVEEAEAYREKIISSRTAEVDAKIKEAEQEIQALLDRHEFEPARRAANRLQRVYPDHEEPRLMGLRVNDAREQYKQDLERQFLEAARREDVDQAMELLKELDKYLTEREAEPFRETARGVIGKQRDNLGVQFKLAVQDKEWVRASSIGEQIIREFPNTKMADEVRGMVDLLRERAAGQHAAARSQAGAPA